MDSVYSDILNPVALVSAQAKAGMTTRHARGDRRVIALLNNSKPNVDFFLGAVAEELRRRGDYEVVNFTKHRSAEPCTDLKALATRCDFAINAVAD
jgi:hypothetical protein